MFAEASQLFQYITKAAACGHSALQCYTWLDLKAWIYIYIAQVVTGA